MKQAKPEMGHTVTCPYCGQKGKVIHVFNDGHLEVEHRTGVRKVVSGGSGLTIEVSAFLDGCSKDGKIGSEHHPTVVVPLAWKELDEEDF